MSKIKAYFQAGYPALYLKTLEPKRAIESIAKELLSIEGKPKKWNMHQGVINLEAHKISEYQEDPLEAIQSLKSLEENTVLFMSNLHHYLSNIEIIQAIQNDLDDWKSRGQCLVVLAPEIKIPIELDRIFTTFDFELPDKAALHKILSDVAEAAGRPLPDHKDALLDLAKGLTTFEAENVFALSVIRKTPFCLEVIADQKAQMVKKNASLEILSPGKGFASLGGLDQLKIFSSKIARSPLARGLLLLGVPGCGKSHFAKALGGELGLPTLSLDFGRVFGSLVGESEERIRQALAVADAMSPCVLMIDEIDKGLSGAGSSQSDGGVGSRIFGAFLTWLNDHQSQVFTVATCNNITHLPAEFTRAERWDGVFFVDLPNEEEREAILSIHAKEYKLKITDLPDMTNWSGAEIKSLCRIAAMMDIPMVQAAQYVIPLAKSMNKNLKALRDWASKKTLPASLEPTRTQRRKITQNFSEN